jgi:2-haloacid dehalogenase
MTRAVIFDLGGVLIDWNPRHLYRKLFDDMAEMERFLAEVCTQDWIATMDEGRPMAVAVAERVARFPEYRAEIEAFHARWRETVVGALEETVRLLAALRERGYPLYVLSNYSAETFPFARETFDFLDWFQGMVISGEVGVKKPDPAIFHILFERHGLAPDRAVYIDDVPENVAAGRALGLEALHFTSAPALRGDLERLGLL